MNTNLTIPEGSIQEITVYNAVKGGERLDYTYILSDAVSLIGSSVGLLATLFSQFASAI